MMSAYEASLRALVISLRGRLKAMEIMDHSSGFIRNEWNMTSFQVDELEAEISSLVKEQPHD